MYYTIAVNDDCYDDDHEDGDPGSLGVVHVQDALVRQFRKGNRIAIDSILEYQAYPGSDNEKYREKYLKFNYLGSIPDLVDLKFKQLITEHFPNDVQTFPAIVHANRKKFEGYYALNVINIFDCVDLSKSKTYRMLPNDANSPLVVSDAFYKEIEMPPGISIAMVKNLNGVIAVSQEFVDICQEANITGIDFWQYGKCPW